MKPKRPSHLRKTMNVFAMICFCFILGVGSSNGQDQNYIDSLSRSIKTATPFNKQKLYIDLMHTYYLHDLGISRTYLDSIRIVHDQNSDDIRLRANYHNSAGAFHGRTSHYDTAAVYFELALKDYKELDDQERVSALLNNIGICQKREGDFEAALATNLESLKLKEKLGVTGDDLAASYWNLGNLYVDLLDYGASSMWYDKAKKIYQDLDMKNESHMVNSLKGQNYLAVDSFDLAEPIFLKSLDYFRKANLPSEVCGALMDLGRTYMKKGDFKKSEKNLIEAYTMSLSSDEDAMPGYAAGQLAKL